MDLDFLPSPVPERPGLLIRDPLRYSDAVLIIPPVLVACLEYFDGERSDLDLRHALVNITGELDVSDLGNHLTETLSDAGFCEDAKFDEMCAESRRIFEVAPSREASHAGGAYPDDPVELRTTLDGYMNGIPKTPPAKVLGIAAPHVSPFGGFECYREAFRALSPADSERTFVILGTSHHGEPDRFGLTRKPYVTPYGATVNDTVLVDELVAAAPGAVLMEDYCHSIEHSIEFQVIFLQHLFGPGVRILPILCGSYARSIYLGGMPEDDEHVRRFLDALGNLSAREGDRLCWVLGIDMAHMGRRYGDRFEAVAERAEMIEVAERDRKRIESINGGDVGGYWDQVRENHDDLKWCGSAPLYTFMKANPRARGSLLRYQQWNIDEQSVVSFAGMSFNG